MFIYIGVCLYYCLSWSEIISRLDESKLDWTCIGICADSWSFTDGYVLVVLNWFKELT